MNMLALLTYGHVSQILLSLAKMLWRILLQARTMAGLVSRLNMLNRESRDPEKNCFRERKETKDYWTNMDNHGLTWSN